jgi:hypothetical protein
MVESPPMPDRPALPNWPRRMRAPLAAAYCGWSERGFWQAIRTKKIREPIKDGRASFWYREDLDVDLDSLKEDNRGGSDPLMEALS